MHVSIHEASSSEGGFCSYFLVRFRRGYRSIVTLHPFGGLQFSTKRTHQHKSHALHASIMHACSVLIRAKTGYTKSRGQVSYLLASLAKHMQRCPMDDDVEFRYVLESDGFCTCVILVPSLGMEFSSPKPQRRKGKAKQSAIIYACKELRKSETMLGNARNKRESPLFACLAKSMDRPPVEKDVQFRYVLDSNNAWRCVIKLPALGDLEFSTPHPQSRKDNAKAHAINRACNVLARTVSVHASASKTEDSRLLVCLAKHMHRTPVEEDVVFRFSLDSNNAWGCVIALHCLEGLEFPTPSPQYFRCKAKSLAISHACAVLQGIGSASPVCAEASNKRESRLLACLAKHMHRPPVEQDVWFRYEVDSNNAWGCVITIRSLGDLEVSTLKPQRRKSNSKTCAISRALIMLKNRCSIHASESIEQGTC
ncbi:unnamed protein product [Polarella glacialis]|uniref:DRBM domain-containing protein n=1 Tax=Polarella glacialis TaxID=89957 RepID=A0A813GBB8_POLGL|nr:unnamed protein product [Polarella glacialis]